jgi:glycosyltransferase involved in cell wall biosynthesis
MNVAIIHDWLTGMRGGERVLELFCKIFPQAPVFTLFHYPGTVSDIIESHKIVVSRLQKIPFSQKHYRMLLPFFPGAVESFDLRDFDCVVSTSHAVAKGAIKGAERLSICYCHTPMRYIWDQYDSYFNTPRTSRIVRFLMPLCRDYLRSWDVDTHKRVNYYIANSRFVSRRIRNVYDRDSVVIPAPVDCRFYTPDHKDPEDFYLIVNAPAPYKRIDLAIEAFNRNGRRLIVIGGGTHYNVLKKSAHQNIEFTGRISDEEVRDHYRRCKAVIFPGVEDFGLVPLEVQACGRPVIAFARGGVLETVIEGVSGHFFHEQTCESLNQGIELFETLTFSSDMIRKRSLEFDVLEIEKKLRHYLNSIFSANSLPLRVEGTNQTPC